MSQLAPGLMVQEYQIEQVLGVGAFGITYRAIDTHLGMPVALKEFFPRQLVRRGEDGTVVPSNPENAPAFDWMKSRFVGEGQVLARFRHPNIVRVWRYLTGNGTAYMVMDFEEGSSLADWLQRSDAPPDEAWLRRLVVPVLEGLREVHRKRFLHRDIKPSNIFLREDGPPCLIDFGAAEVELGSSRDSANVLTHGYAPIEQYGHRGPLGPASDLYALGATLYRCISGRLPTDARVRQRALADGRGEPMRAARVIGRGRYTRELLELVDWMTALRPEDRPRSVDQVLARLGAEGGERAGGQPAGGLQLHQRLLFVGTEGAGKRSAMGALCDGPLATRDARFAFGSQAPPGEVLSYGRLLLPPGGQLHLYGIELPRQARALAAAVDRGVLGLVFLADNRSEEPVRDLGLGLPFLEQLPAGAGAAVAVTHTDYLARPGVAEYHAHLRRHSPRARTRPPPVFEVDARSPREVGLLLQALLYSIDPGA